MTPSDILLYSWTTALFCHHQRSFLWQQLKTIEAHNQSERPWNIQPYMGLSPSNPCSGLREPCERGSISGQRAQRARPSEAQRLQQHVQGLHLSSDTYDGLQFSALEDSWVCEQEGLAIPCAFSWACFLVILGLFYLSLRSPAVF